MTKFAHRFRETTNATNMATVALAGAVVGGQTLAKVISKGASDALAIKVGDDIQITIEDTAGNWEERIYTVTTPTLLTSKQLLDSSNDGAAVTTWSGTRTVFCTPSAQWLSTVLTTADGVIGVRDIPFSQSVPLSTTGTAYMPQYTVTGALSFTPAAGAVKGAFAYVGIVADGASAVTFPGFKQAIGSGDYDNRAGILNVLEFAYDGYNYWYAISQAVGAVPVDTVAPTVTGAAVANGTPTILTLTASEALDPNNTPAASAFTVTGHTVSAVAVAGAAVNLTVSAAFANGEAARTASYVQPGANGLRDQAGNLMASFGPLAITNNVQPVDVTPPTVSSAQVANASPTVIQITMSESLANSVPPASAFAVSGGKTVSSVAINGAVVSLTCSAAYVSTDTITATYTAPGANPRLQDAAGNATTSFGPVGVTNNVAAAVTTTGARLTNLTSVTETGTDPYTYTGTGGALTNAVGGVTAKSLAANANGYLEFVITSDATEVLVGFSVGSNLTVYGNMRFCLYAPGDAGGAPTAYRKLVNGAANALNAAGLNPAAGDILRVTRVGNVLKSQLARAATPTTFVDLDSYDNGSAPQMWVQATITGTSAIRLTGISGFA